MCGLRGRQLSVGDLSRGWYGKFKFHFQTELNIPCEIPWRGHAEYTHEHASTPQDTQDNITNIANFFFPGHTRRWRRNGDFCLKSSRYSADPG